jgi:hypothetical protein
LDISVLSQCQDTIVSVGDDTHLDVIGIVEVPTCGSIIEGFQGAVEEVLEGSVLGGFETKEIPPGLGDRKGH